MEVPCRSIEGTFGVSIIYQDHVCQDHVSWRKTRSLRWIFQYQVNLQTLQSLTTWKEILHQNLELLDMKIIHQFLHARLTHLSMSLLLLLPSLRHIRIRCEIDLDIADSDIGTYMWYVYVCVFVSVHFMNLVREVCSDFV